MQKKTKHEAQPCDGCVHWRKLVYSATGRTSACHYCVDTGKLRGCEPGEGCARRASSMTRRRWANQAVEIIETGG